MEFEWDESKRIANLAKHKIDFKDATVFNWSEAVIKQDIRTQSELRYRAYGPLRGRLMVLCFTPRKGRIRIISFRKANPRERKKYGH